MYSKYYLRCRIRTAVARENPIELAAWLNSSVTWWGGIPEPETAEAFRLYVAARSQSNIGSRTEDLIEKLESILRSTT